MQRIKSVDGLAPSLGPYSLAIVDGDTVFTAGQIGITATGTISAGGIEAEARQALDNLHNILQAAGSDFNHVIKTTLYLTNSADFVAVNTIYGGYFAKAAYPARETIVVASLPMGAKIEISMIAKRKKETT